MYQFVSQIIGTRLRSNTNEFHPPGRLSNHRIRIIFDKYMDFSPKSHECSKRTVSYPEYEIRIDSILPVRDHIMKTL